MNRAGTSILVAIVAGVAAVYLLPPRWLAPLSAGVAVCGVILAIILRLGTRAEPPAIPLVRILLSLSSLPEQPLAKVKAGWALTTFLAAAAFLVAIALSVMVRAHS